MDNQETGSLSEVEVPPHSVIGISKNPYTGTFDVCVSYENEFLASITASSFEQGLRGAVEEIIQHRRDEIGRAFMDWIRCFQDVSIVKPVCRMLLLEIMASHRDPDDPSYNNCDEAPCDWCESAQKVLDGGIK